MDDCIFCRIVRGEIPSRKVYEDGKTLAFMDVAGDVDGHLLVIPKTHVVNLLDCDQETLDAVMHTVKRVGDHLVQDCGYDGLNILNANDACAGQSVFHLHIHLIPRRQNDGISAWPVFDGAHQDIDEIYRKIRM